MKKTMILWMVVLAVVLSGCTTTRTSSRTRDKKATRTSTKSKKTVAPGNHEVVRGDTLWGISGTQEAYSDHMQWPLLFKYNRDIIKDPDLIYPGQVLKIQKNVTDEEVAQARKAASETPPYQPHNTPRETLPLDYF